MNGDRSCAPATGKGTLLTHSAGLLSALLWGLLAFRSQLGGHVPLEFFFSVLAGVWFLLLSVIYLFRKSRHAPCLSSILFWAIAFRILGLGAEPVYENDYYRFLWDGWVFSQTGNPFSVPPLDYFGQPELPDKMEHVLHRVGYPEVPTVYGPTLQAVFLAASVIAPGDLLTLKLFFVAADLALLLLMGRVLNRSLLLLFAWCPLLVFETSFNAHPDVIGALLIALSVEASRARRHALALALCASAVGVKVIAILVLPFLLLAAKPKHVLVFGGVIMLLYAPFVLQGTMGELEGLRIFGQYWEFNSSFYAILQELLGSEKARPLSLAFFALSYLAILFLWQRKRDAHLPLDTVFGLFFITSPVFNPWYLIWLAPFAIRRLRAWSLTALMALPLSYITGMNLGDSALGPFNHPRWLRPVEFGAIALAVIFDVIRARRRPPQDFLASKG